MLQTVERDTAAESLEDLCKRVEAYETPFWAIDAVLEVELTTQHVIDPCAGLGAIGEVCRDRELLVEEMDIENWPRILPGKSRVDARRFWQRDFFEELSDLSELTVIMNPPFTQAERFVDHAKRLNARKIICFQRQAWRESAGRRQWWEANPPSRVWVCGSRATCWRFDLLGTDLTKRGGSTTSMAWYVWERGHKGAEVTSAIYPEASR